MRATGCDVITRFPADELLVAGHIYVRGADLVEGGDDGLHDRRTPNLAAAVASSAVVEPAGVPR